MNHKRAVADVIAALVLIFITIIVAEVVFMIATNYAGKLSNNVGVQITSAQITPLPGGGAVPQVTVHNTGTVPEAINVSTGQTFKMWSLNMKAYVYFANQPWDWSLEPYPFTVTVPAANLYETTNCTAPPYDYGVGYSGSYLGMPVEPFPVGIMKTYSTQTSEGYIATGSFMVSQTTTYTFQVVVDDGTAIWINGPSTNGQWANVLPAGAWPPAVGENGQGATYYSGTETLKPGTYQIAIEYMNVMIAGLSAIKITPSLATLIQPGQVVSGTFILNGYYAVGQSVTLTATAYSISGTATTATTVLVS